MRSLAALVRRLRLLRARLARGYTMTEVMVSLSLVAIGGAGVITMQRATIQGNADARRLDMANAVARQWVERLRTDAMLWTTPSARQPNSNFANAALLQTVNGQWHRPDARLSAAPYWSAGTDVLGADVPVALLDAVPSGSPPEPAPYLYCTHVRLTWLVTNEVLRADVRVFWPRGVGVASPPTDYARYCGAAINGGLETATDAYHFVYATTAIRRNAVQ